MRLAFALSIVCALAGTIHAKDWDEMSGLNGTPFVDKTAQAFFDANPAAMKTFVANNVDKLMLPGGVACQLPDYPDTKGTSSIYLSPDKKTLVFLGSAQLSKRNAKALKLAAEPDTKAHVLVVIDGPSGAMWTKRLDRDGCTFIDATGLWSADGTKLLAIARYGMNITEDVYAIVIDLAKKKLQLDRYAIIDTDGASLDFVSYADAAFASASRVTFCATPEGKTPAKYRVDDDGVTKVGACTAAKPTPAPAK